MEAIYGILSALNFVPFGAELCLFVLLTIPGVLLIPGERRSPETITRVTLWMLSMAVLLVGLVKLGLQMAFGEGLPLWLLVSNTGIAAVVLVFSFFRTALQVFLALCVAFVLHLVSVSAFTHVTVTRTLAATYKATPSAPGPGVEYGRHYVELHLKNAPGYFFYVYSEPLTRHLAHSGKMEVPLEVQLRYHWGLLAGHSLQKVDGREWKTEGQGGFGVQGTSPTPYPFEKTFYGLGD
ncbi:membrane hypothetical protein [Nitrospina gracilis 3/211]|uniref:Uncharacterized protein n=1 Tax=Nitrospina gracilis (strain 3/211) TaxID=1266370 RepID=M1YW46_NITG3|nr:MULTISPECIES: hypothetical protein [Nitrospina]MCF8722911.1 hypothetical protein [Nitrospina sp. Nb-3]CCQ89876.1 membrane hypothetical protein [Nitrospina gracilis 3/211]